MNIKRFLTLVTLTTALVSNMAWAEMKGLDHYFKKPQYAGFQLSPNGKELAGLVPVNNRMNIAIINLHNS